ncbi:MAG TPA: hypothetical protein VI874_05505, partial [Candidatus Norongarragalinales archaeon]|nr:hypothetical protein [Candidatus Norongarragalinales archaeon]
GRFGRLPRSQRKNVTPDTKALIGAIQRHEIKIRQWAARTSPPRSLARIQSRHALLLILRQRSQRVRALDLAAALAFQHGLEKDQLLRPLNDAHEANKPYHANGTLFEGTMTVAMQSVKHDALHQVHQLLHQTPRVMTPVEIAMELGLPKEVKYVNRVRTALNLLARMKLVHVLPNNENNEYLWVHACHRQIPQTIPVWNNDWKVLQALRAGPKNVLQISKPVRERKPGELEQESVSTAFTRLHKAGLVRAMRIRGGGKQAKLTEYAKQILEDQDRLNFLHLELEEALMGVPREVNEMDPYDREVLERIKRWADIHRTVQKMQSELPLVHRKKYSRAKEAAAVLGVKLGSIHSVIVVHFPVKHITRRRFEEVFLPALERENPEMAEYVRAHFKPRFIEDSKS